MVEDVLGEEEQLQALRGQGGVWLTCYLSCRYIYLLSTVVVLWWLKMCWEKKTNKPMFVWLYVCLHVWVVYIGHLRQVMKARTSS